MVSVFEEFFNSAEFEHKADDSDECPKGKMKARIDVCIGYEWAFRTVN